MNITALKASLPEGSHVDEDLDSGGGCISIYAPDFKAWANTGTNTAAAVYYDTKDWNQTRAGAINSLIEDASGGLMEATEDTIYEMGW